MNVHDINSATPEQRDLLLSRFIDNELEPGLAEAVARRVDVDEEWRDVYGQLRRTEQAVHGAVVAHRLDEQFVDRVMSEAPPPPRRPRTGLYALIAIGAIGALLAVWGAAATWRIGQQRQMTTQQPHAGSGPQSAVPSLADADRVHAGDVVQTGAEARAVRIGQALVIVGPESEARINTRGEDLELEIAAGQAFANVSGEALPVQLDGTRGTVSGRALIRARRDGALESGVPDGMVIATYASIRVYAGEATLGEEHAVAGGEVRAGVGTPLPSMVAVYGAGGPAWVPDSWLPAPWPCIGGDGRHRGRAGAALAHGNDSQVRALKLVEAAEEGLQVFGPVITAGGDVVALVQGEQPNGQLVVATRDGKTRRVALPGQVGGHPVVAHDDAVLVPLTDGRVWRVKGEQASTLARLEGGAFSLLPFADRWLFVGGRGRVLVHSPEGDRRFSVADPGALFGHPPALRLWPYQRLLAVTADGQRVLFHGETSDGWLTRVTGIDKVTPTGERIVAPPVLSEPTGDPGFSGTGTSGLAGMVTAQGQVLVCYDGLADEGHETELVSVPGGVKAPPVVMPAGGFVPSLLLGSRRGEFFRLSKEGGEGRPVARLERMACALPGREPVAAMCVVGNQAIVLTDPGWAYVVDLGRPGATAVDPQTGEEVRVPARAPRIVSRHDAGARKPLPFPAVDRDGTVYWLSEAGVLLALRPSGEQ